MSSCRSLARLRPWSRRAPARLRAVALGLALLATSLFVGAAGAAPLAEHVVLVSVDGLRPEMVLDPAWPAPTLQQRRATGAWAEAVEGVFPSVTYPSHTTLVTGVVPARHRIDYNEVFEPAGETGRWHWEASRIRVPTLWELVRVAGGRTASIGWPVTVGASIDDNVPEVWSLEAGADAVAVLRAASRPAGLFEELEREATGRLTSANFTYGSLARDDRAGEAAAYLLARRRPSLLLVHFYDVDHSQHDFGRDSPRLRRAVAAVDRAIGKIVEAAEAAGIADRTAFVVTGDHGFIDTHTLLAPNVWLVEAGLRGAGSDRGGDWRATFHTASASAFLHLRDPADRAAVDGARARLAALPTGIRQLFRLVERDELDRLGAAPDAVLALAPSPGATFTIASTGAAVRPSRGANHGFLPAEPRIRTGLVAWGAGIRPGAVAPLLRLVDVAPLVAALLGLDLRDADGALPAGFLVAPETAPGG